MAIQRQLRRGSTSVINNSTGAEGELFYDVQQKQLVLQDGVTKGGIRIPRQAEVNVVQNAVNTKSSVSILTGTISNGGTIPLPSGYTEAQCKWMVSVSDTTLANLGANNQSADFLQIKCFTTGRVVTATISFYNPSTPVGANTYDKPINAQYMIIGVK